MKGGLDLNLKNLITFIIFKCTKYYKCVHAFILILGALPLEDLLKMYNLEQPSSKRMTGNHSGEEESEDVSMDRERKMSCTSNSSQDSGDEGNFDASSEEDEVKYGKEWDGLEFLVSGKSIEEVHLYVS